MATYDHHMLSPRHGNSHISKISGVRGIESARIESWIGRRRRHRQRYQQWYDIGIVAGESVPTTGKGSGFH